MEELDRPIDMTYQVKYQAANPAMVPLETALNDPEHRGDWIIGITSECRSVDQCWIWEKPPPGFKPLPSRILLCRKSDGRFKASIVVIGFLQWFNSHDNTSTYAPTASSDVFRAVIALSAGMGWRPLSHQAPHMSRCV